jgi:hypothetical protein
VQTYAQAWPARSGDRADKRRLMPRLAAPPTGNA